MKNILNDDRPIYIQIKDQVEDSIVAGHLQPGDRVPSTNEFANFYKINPATAAKGINELVAEEILYKRRGVGMFVTDNARNMLVEKRKRSFYEHFILPLQDEAKKLNISKEEIIHMVRGENQQDED